MMKKVLILNQSYMQAINSGNRHYIVDFMMLYKKIPAFFKLFRFLHQKLRLPFFSIWYVGGWKKIFKSYDMIILHDAIAYHNNYFINKINQYSDKNTKLYLYYWNNVYDLDLLKNTERWEILSFNYEDAKKHNLRYVGGFYCPMSIKEQKPIYDLFFIGINKGRFPFVEKIKEEIQKIGIIPHFYLVSLKHFINKKYSKAIPYKKMLTELMKSRAVLDIAQDKQFGFTLRVYEAIFYQKKLVTNNTNIRNYNVNLESVFIIDNDFDPLKLKEFLNSNFTPFSKEIQEQYLFENWLERIDKKQECKDVNF